MKEKIIITTIAAVFVVILGVGIYQSEASQAGPRLSESEISQMVRDQYPGAIKSIELEKDFNHVVYHVEVENEGEKYALELDGNSGKVLNLEANGSVKKELVIEEMPKDTQASQAKQAKESTKEATKEKEKKTNEKEQVSTSQTDQDEKINIQERKPEVTAAKQQETKQVKKEDKPVAKKEPVKESTKKPAKKTVIDSDTALGIALKEFPGKATEVELDEDDGRLLYEIEIESSKGEAEMEIDAYTGEILAIEIDLDD